jgi:hypothetical protein
MLLDIIDLQENRFGVQGHPQDKFSAGQVSNPSITKDPVEAKKSKVKVYPSIMDALRHGTYGQIFSTVGSKRLYVITKQKWGTSSEQRVGDKVAKGFSPGTIPSNFGTVKQYALRTMEKYGKSNASDTSKVRERDTGE